MKLLRLILAFTAVTFLLAPVAAQNSLEAELQRAIQKETTTGDLPAAIAEYQRIADRAGASNPTVAAKALFCMARAYEKLGDERAVALYRVIRDSGDRPTAGEARLKLAAMSAPATAPQGGAARRVVWTISEPADIYGAVSRDGRYLAYGDYRLGELFTRDLTTGANRRITNTAVFTNSPAREFAPGEAAFSPDGRRLAYNWWKSQHAESASREPGWRPRR